jgi:molecular chaperone DnaK
VPADVRQEVEGKIAAIKTALQGKDVDALRSSSQELTQSLQKIGAAVYGQQAGANPQGPDQGPGPQEPPPPGKPDEGTVEGEFREV